MLFESVLSGDLVQLRRDLGVIKHHVSAVTEWIMHSVKPKAAAQRLLAKLSSRAQLLTAALPNVTTVYGLFLVKGPSLNGSHFRYGVRGVWLVMFQQCDSAQVLKLCSVIENQSCVRAVHKNAVTVRKSCHNSA